MAKRRTKTLKVGVAGMRRGVSFGNVLRSRKDCVVAAVCDPIPERAESAAKTLGAKPFTDYEKFCKSDIEAVAIVTPAPTHAECSIIAAENGKHVLCEVPAVFSLDEARQVVRAVEKSGVKYMFAENMCYFAFIQTMHKMVKDGRLGELFYAEGEYIHDCRSLMEDRPDGLGGGEKGRPTWRASMPPIQYCTHDLGPILMMMEDRVVSASGLDTGSHVLPKYNTIDMEVGIFKTAKGAVVKILCGFSVERHPAFHFISLYGTGGSMETDRYNPSTNLKAYLLDIPHMHGMMNIPVSVSHMNAPPEAKLGGHGTSEYFMIGDFVRCILDDTKPAIDVYEGMDYTLPGICAHLSARQGGQAVEVPDLRPKKKRKTRS
ncbi:MAG: Gfo/Idh/MocA family oxidoreductase [Planctomycetota bacterium]